MDKFFADCKFKVVTTENIAGKFLTILRGMRINSLTRLVKKAGFMTIAYDKKTIVLERNNELLIFDEGQLVYTNHTWKELHG